MDADGSRQLCDTGYGQFNLLACRHDEVTVLVDNHYDIRHKAVAVVRVELTVAELLVVFLYILGVSSLQQVVALIHLQTETLERLDDLVNVCNDGLFAVFVALNLCQEMVDDRTVEVELHFLRVNHHQFQFGRMLFIEERGDDGIQADRLTLSSSTCNQQMRHLGQVGHKDFVGDGLAECHRKFVVCFLELTAVQDALHRYHLRLSVRHLNANSSLTRDGSNDTDAQGAKA